MVILSKNMQTQTEACYKWQKKNKKSIPCHQGCCVKRNACVLSGDSTGPRPKGTQAVNLGNPKSIDARELHTLLGFTQANYLSLRHCIRWYHYQDTINYNLKFDF